MGTVTFFVLFCGIVHLVNLCYSFVIDFEKEREDLYAAAGIKDGKCTESEAFLVKKAIERKQEVENERELRERVEQNLTDANKNIGKLNTEKEKYKSIVAVVTGGGVLEDFYKKYVKQYVRIKSPYRHKPNGYEIEDAYVDFMYDSTNPVAQRFLKLFPGWTPREIAENLRQLFGRLSDLTHNYYDTLRKMSNFEALLQLLESLPASLITQSEIHMTENVLRALKDFSDENAP